MGTSSTRAKNKYNATHYDYFRILVPKGKKDIIKDFVAQNGESLNGFINRLIDEAIRDNDNK